MFKIITTAWLVACHTAFFALCAGLVFFIVAMTPVIFTGAAAFH